MLPEDKRAQLDGIVQKMVANKESDSNIKFVVDDFKKKYTQEAPPPAPAAQPSFLDKATAVAKNVPGAGAFAESLGGSIQAIGQAGNQALHGDFGGAGATLQGQGAQNNANMGKILGDAGQAFLTPASVGIGGPAGTGALKVAARIGTNVALGAGVGGANALAQGAGAGEIAKQAITGGVTGGVLSGVSEAYQPVKNALLGSPGTKIAEALTPKLTPTKYAAAGKLGQIEAPGMFAKGGVSVDAPQVQTAAKAVHDAAAMLGKTPDAIIKTGPLSSASANLNSVNKTIGDYSESVVKPLLSSNPIPTNFEDFIGYIKQIKAPQAITADKEAHSTFNRVRERIINDVYKSLKSQSKAAGDFGSMTDPNILWNARKTIDRVITEELGAKALSDPGRSGVKAAAPALRQGVADFISDSLRFPGQMEQVARYHEIINTLREKGIELGKAEYHSLAEQLGLNPIGAQVANQWDTHMSTLSGLYHAATNLSTKVPAERGKNLIQLMAKKHPTTTKVIEYGAGAVGAGALFKAGQNLLSD